MVSDVCLGDLMAFINKIMKIMICDKFNNVTINIINTQNKNIYINYCTNNKKVKSLRYKHLKIGRLV